jgi:hypothetical protein
MRIRASQTVQHIRVFSKLFLKLLILSVCITECIRAAQYVSGRINTSQDVSMRLRAYQYVSGRINAYQSVSGSSNGLAIFKTLCAPSDTAYVRLRMYQKVSKRISAYQNVSHSLKVCFCTILI